PGAPVRPVERTDRAVVEGGQGTRLAGNADRHDQLPVVLILRAFEFFFTREQGRFWCTGKREAGVWSADHVEAFGEIGGVEGTGNIFALHLDRYGFGS